MNNKTLTGQVLGETEYKASHAGVGYDAVEVVRADARSYRLADTELAFVLAALVCIGDTIPTFAGQAKALHLNLMTQAVR